MVGKLTFKNWKKYTFEFLSIFVAVISAFALNNWNDARNARHAEEKILLEIKNGIQTDMEDFDSNVANHELALRANVFYRDLINGKDLKQDSAAYFNILLFRDFTPIVNLSGYESLKSSGMKTIKDDRLRFDIIKLYDYHYNIITKLEDEIEEMSSYSNYFHRTNEVLHPFMIFDDQGRLRGFESPVKISDNERKELLSYLWRLEINRRFKLSRYDRMQKEMQKVIEGIEKELE